MNKTTTAWLGLGSLFLIALTAACSVNGSGNTNPAPNPEAPAVVDEPPPAQSAEPPPGSKAPPIGPACEVLTPRTSPLEIFVQPAAGSTPFTAAISRAKTSVDVMVYQMGFGPILEGLEAKAKAGVKVRAILDLAQKNVNQKYMDRLIAAGANVIWSDPQFTFMHAKMILVDNTEAIISTGNYSESYITKERNYAVRNTDPADIDVLSKLFESDFARTAPDLNCTRLLVSPVNAKQRLLDFIASAKKEVLVESMQLGDKDVRDALAARKAAGVEVRALLADPSWIDANADAAVFLREKQIEARWMKSLHVKSILVDGEAAFIGSENLSWTSLTKNREVGLVTNEPDNAKTVKATFETDWAIGSPFAQQ